MVRILIVYLISLQEFGDPHLQLTQNFVQNFLNFREDRISHKIPAIMKKNKIFIFTFGIIQHEMCFVGITRFRG